MKPYEEKFTDLIGKIKYQGTQSDIDSKPKGARAYFVCTYAKYEQLTDLFAYCERFAWITHDRDVYPDGTSKAVHSHFIVRYRDEITATAFAKRIYRLVQDEQTIISYLGDKYCALDYMLHRDVKSVDAGKTLYKESEILSDDLSYFIRGSSEAKAKANNEDFFADLLDGSLSKRAMALKYGRDYAKNIRQYEQFKKEVLQEEYVPSPVTDLEKLDDSGIDIACIVWQLVTKYAPRIKAGCTIPSYNLIKYDVDAILSDQQGVL